MYPIFFQLGPLTLHAFGLMMALGFVAALAVMRRLSRRGFGGLDDDQLARLIVWIMAGGIVGARLAYVAEHWSSEFAANPGAIIRIDQGGLMFYGGVLGAILAIGGYARRGGRPLLDLLDLCAVGLPLGHAFGRLGCFLNGCCYGHVCRGAFGVGYPAGSLAWREQVAAGLLPAAAASSLPVVPTQLIELAANLAIFGFLLRLARRHPSRGRVTSAYLLLYAVVRFATEILRGDPRLTQGGLSIGQWISILIFAIGLGLAGTLRWGKGRQPAPRA
jgi:phosphatidylglycerol:prolipoprotein diacylglycerol transferase